MFYAKPKHPTTRVAVLDAVFLIEHVPDALAYMGEEMTPMLHPQHPAVWRVTADGTVRVNDLELERVVLDAAAPQADHGDDAHDAENVFVKPADHLRKAHIHNAFWDGLISLQEAGDVRREGNVIVSKVVKTELARATRHSEDIEDRNALRNLKATLEAYGLKFRAGS